MRWLISAICTAGALVLIGASMWMNWTFWSGQGTDVSTGLVLGAVSIGIDIFKAMLPLLLVWAWHARAWLISFIGALFFCGCVLFSYVSALGYAASSRGAVTGSRETVMLRYQAGEQEKADIKGRLAVLGNVRPQAVIEEALARAKQDRRWSSSRGCTDATVEASLSFCRGLGDLRIELASAVESERLRARGAELQVEIDRLLSAGARQEQDSQAALLARLTGLQVGPIQSSITTLFALLVEFGAAFGLVLARVARQGDTEPLRVCRRLQLLRRWSHDIKDNEQIFA